jgi:twitching motility protein PilT
VEGPPLRPEDTEELMRSITSEEHVQQVRERGTVDFGFAFGELARFRVSVFKEKGNFGVVARQIPTKLLKLEEIGIPPSVRELLYKPRGLVLVTGPTGSGKTTTLASMINIINEERDDAHIITIEDPIEYYHQHKKCTVNQREIGVDVPNFPEALRRALRMDPDIILVGEMRDLATIHAAIEAAETGHVVFATLHTSGAASTINRIIDVFPKEQQDQIRTQLSTAMIGVLSQAILPRKPDGLVAAFEMMVVTPAIQNLIRENKVYRIDSSIQTGRKHGMFLLDENLFKLWKDGTCEKEEVLLRSSKPQELAAKIAQAERGIFEEDEFEDEEEDEDEDYDDEDEDEDDDDDRHRRGRRK